MGVLLLLLLLLGADVALASPSAEEFQSEQTAVFMGPRGVGMGPGSMGDAPPAVMCLALTPSPLRIGRSHLAPGSV